MTRSAKTYVCPYCGVTLTHDDIFKHVQHTCPKRLKR